jgi:outer membrane beta-barrel protein
LQQNLSPEPESSQEASETHNRPLTTRDQKKLNISDYSKLISGSAYDAYNVLQKNPMVKSSHFQLNMGVTKVINDGFNSNFGLQLGGIYHFNETWGLGLGGTVLSSSRSSQTKNLQEVQMINVDQLWTLKNTYNASLYVTPVYGKWTLLNQKIRPFEIYFSVGAAQVTDQSNQSNKAISATIVAEIYVKDERQARVSGS